MAYQYANKDKSVKIFREIRSKNQEGSSHIIREYQHSEYVTYSAYMRQLSDGEKQVLGATLSDARFFIAMNARSVEVGYYVEYRGDAYRIEGIDFFELDGTEMTLRLSASQVRPYDEMRYKS